MGYILIRLERQQCDVPNVPVTDYLLNLFEICAITDQNKMNILIGLQSFGHFHEHIHVLRQPYIAVVGDIELRTVQTIFIKQFILCTRNIHHRILVHPVIDNLNLLLRHSLRHDVLLEVLRDDDDLVCIAVGEVFYHTPYLPEQAAFLGKAGTR